MSGAVKGTSYLAGGVIRHMKRATERARYGCVWCIKGPHVVKASAAEQSLRVAMPWPPARRGHVALEGELSHCSR